MESDAESGAGRNDILSQSYAECVERVAQQKNDGGFGFDLPKEVLEERQKVWDNFFHKYGNQVSGDVELDMNTMKPAEAEDEEEAEGEDDEDEDEEEDDDDDEKEYYSKCRAPLRKLPALIQYWIDTGNPPYQLVGDDDHTETGSSLSEGEHSRSGHSAVLRESSEKQKSNTSRFSSVDTAAYILSNTNVTKKAETLAIVEGAKSSADDFVSKVSPSPLKEVLAVSAEMTKSAVIPSANRLERSPGKMVQAATPIASIIAAESAKLSTTTPLKVPQANRSILSASKLLQTNLLASQPAQVSSPGQQSVKLSEILPELQEFDEMLKRSSAFSPPRTRSSLSKVRRKPKLQPLEKSAEQAEGQISRLQNRRRLYTGRDSPVDLVVERSNGQVALNNQHSLHPALEGGNSRDEKAERLAARAARVRRKRKRASQISQIHSQDGNTSQESDQPIGNENSRSDARYTDFFQSLGLTPSKVVDGAARGKKPIARRSKKTERQVLPKRAKSVAPINVSMESSIKESENTSQTEEEDLVLSPAEKTKNLKNPAEEILGNKIVNVRIERLSEETLARYKSSVCKDGAKNKDFKSGNCFTRNYLTSSCSSSDKKERRHSNLEKIELLTTLTHDSDSSTILICSCNESDGSSVARKDSRTRKMSLRVRGSDVESKKPKITENFEHRMSKAFVKIEKLKVDDLVLSDSTKKLKSVDSEAAQKDTKIIFKTSLSPRNGPVKVSQGNGKKFDLFGGNAIENAIKSLEKSSAKRARCSLGISIPSDEEEDSFVKLISGIGGKRDSKLEDATREEKGQINGGGETRNLGNGDGRIQTEKLQNPFSIVATSEEDNGEVYVRVTRRRTRNVVSRDEKTRSRRIKTEDDLMEEEKNGGKAVKLDNRLDESNRRKLASERAAKNEAHVKIENGGVKGRRKSARTAISALEDEAEMEIVKSDSDAEFEGLRFALNEKYAKILSGKSRDTRNCSAASQKSDLTDDLGGKEEISGIASVLNSGGRSNQSKSRNSSRFQTRVDSDSDAEFEDLKFSLNEKFAKILSGKSRVTRNRSATSGKSVLTEDLAGKDGNSSVASVLDSNGRLNESKSRNSSSRFQTRVDSDSDAEFEDLKFSLNEKFAKILSGKSRVTRNRSATSGKSVLTEDLAGKDGNSSVASVLDSNGRLDESKSRNSSSRFQTRVGSDSDAEFEDLKFSLNEKFAKILSGKSRVTRNRSATSGKSDLTEDLAGKDGNSSVASVLDSNGRLDESKSRNSSLRFQTRVDSDSDAEFEELRFSLNEKWAKISPAKSTNTKNLFATSGKSDLMEPAMIPVWDNKDLDWKDENFGAASALQIVGKSEESRSNKSIRAERETRKITRNSLRFRAKDDNDSDAELKGLKFSLNDKYFQRSPTRQSNEVAIAKSNGSANVDENEPEIEETAIIRALPRRSFKILSERRHKNGERKLRKRGRNLFEDESNSANKSVDSLENEATRVETFLNNGLELLNDLPTNGTNDSSGKPRKTRPRAKSERGNGKNSAKSNATTNRSPVPKQQNGESRASPPSKKKKVRRTRILGNPMDWESDGDTDSNDRKTNANIAKPGKGSEALTNGDLFKQSKDKDTSNNEDFDIIKRQETTKSLFSDSIDDTAEDVDLLFAGAAKTRNAKNTTFIDKLKFASMKKHNNLSVGRSTMSFRTRLASDTEDDGES